MDQKTSWRPTDRFDCPHLRTFEPNRAYRECLSCGHRQALDLVPVVETFGHYPDAGVELRVIDNVLTYFFVPVDSMFGHYPGARVELRVIDNVLTYFFAHGGLD